MTMKTTMVSTLAICAFLSTAATVATNDHPIWNDGVNSALEALNLSEQEAIEVQSAVEQFREDRRSASDTLRSTGENLPPQEEILAVRTYSEASLEERLAHLLSEEQLETLMAAIHEQREQQLRLQAQR
ncbi:hypothetical protein [Marinimicrobium sp. ABcell2]|uniref:hypothetical protein n=1 Tax=Marinimicrobium sp. ABcell2 TaxID=3069751 RepID=UPI0027B61B4A|nr:hypothetical protein [Marinimicrobium sp. ABcell2]MDQ2076851.1 hypothetical protein [Marinimicrobium sp. ABcell2]